MKQYINYYNLFTGLFLVLCMVNVFDIYHLFHRLEMFEIIFGVLAFVVFLNGDWKKLVTSLKDLNFIDKGVLFLLIILFFNVMFNLTRSAAFDLFSIFYLSVVYFVFSRANLFNIELEHFIQFSKLGLSLAIITSLGGLLSYYFTGQLNITTNHYANYPYLGNTIRLQGLSLNPNHHLSVLTIFTLIILAFKKHFSRLDYLLLILGFCCIFLTFAKEVLFSIIAISLMILYKKDMLFFFKKKIFIVMSIGLLLVSTFLIFFKLCTVNCFEETWSVGPAMYQLSDNIYIRPTGYYYLWIGEWNAFLDNPIFGNGFGNFVAYLRLYGHSVGYPTFVPFMQSHNLYTGLLCDLGLMCLVLFSYSVFNINKTLIELKNEKSTYFYVLLIMFFFLIFQGMGCVDYVFVRHHWVLLGIISFIYNEHKRVLAKNNHKENLV